MAERLPLPARLPPQPPFFFTYPHAPAARALGPARQPLSLFLLPFAMLLIDVACCEREENSLSYPCANV